MRTAIITLAMVCGPAFSQVWSPSDNGNLLWEKEQKNQFLLVPSRIIQTPLDGVRLYTDVERGTWGKISDIGGGQYLITESGPDGDSLTIVNQQQGVTTWTRN